MRTFTFQFEERRRYTITTTAPDFDRARAQADIQWDTDRERHADGEPYRVLVLHTCAADLHTGQAEERYVLEFTEKHPVSVTVEADDPAEAEEEVREYWDSYAHQAHRPGGYVLTLGSVEPEVVWQARQGDRSQSPF